MITSHALEQIYNYKCCSNRSHLSGCFKCSSLLVCKARRVQLSTYSPIGLSRIHFADSLYFCPADCFQEIMFEQAGNSHWHKLAFLQHIKTDYSGPTRFLNRNVGIDTSVPCTRESKNKFGSKCDAFGADMSSRISAPGTSCSKETVLRIGFMINHHSRVQHVNVLIAN